MKLCSISSGSSGNCIYVGSDSTAVLVDAGISGKRIEAGLNTLDETTRDISAILVTHDLSEAISMADRILVLTRRPGHIKAILPIRFSSDQEDSPLNRRNSAEFAPYFNLVWKELRHDE